MATQAIRLEVGLDRIFLDLENPRHEPYDKQAEVIDYLCRHENILPLAKDIVAEGLNPIEQFALIPDDEAENDPPTYFVAEGNRRVCALMLLADPELSPSKHRKTFEQLSVGWAGVGLLPCVLFEDRPAVDLWLTRIHDGEQDGVGRRKWSADQSQRHSGSKKNKVALAVLDYAEATGLITSQGRKGKLTTVQRYLVNNQVKAALGIDASNPDDVRRDRPKEEFDLLLTKFLDDLAHGMVNSRAKEPQIAAYATELAAVKLDDPAKVAPEPLTKGKGKGKATGKRRRKAHRPRAYLTFEHEISDALEALGSHKLPSLYNSICSVALNPHAPLVSIGAWAFLESLSAKAGRKITSDFLSFFNKDRLQKYGLAVGKGDKAISEALRRASASGDVTKHDSTAAMFNGEQLANDMDTLKNLILKCIEEAASQPS